MPIEKRIPTKYSQIRNAAALRGDIIGQVGTGTVIFMDMDLKKDGWAPIVGPGDLGPTWKATKKQGWVEIAHTVLVSDKETQYLLTLGESGEVLSCVRLS